MLEPKNTAFFGFGFSLTPKQGSCDPPFRPRAPGQPWVGFLDHRLVHTSTRISLGARFPFSTVSSWSGRPLARQQDLGYGTPASLNPVTQTKQDRGNYASREGSVSLQPQFGEDHPLHPLGPQHPPPLPAPGLHSYPMLSWSDSGIVFPLHFVGFSGIFLPPHLRQLEGGWHPRLDSVG